MPAGNWDLRLSWPLFGVLLGVALAAAGCSSSSGDKSCTTDGDCPAGQFCILQKCVILGNDGGIDGSSGGDDGGTADGADQGGDPGIQQGVEVLRKPIGTGVDEIGCVTEEEGEAVGPMSFAVADDGTIYVLDQNNQRVQVYRNNALLRSLPLPNPDGDAQDIDVTSSGNVLVLDVLVDKALYVLDGSNGSMLRKIVLEGRNIPYAPEVTGVFFQSTGQYAGIWVEIDERAVRLAGTDGVPDVNRISVPGVLTAKGDKLVRASVIGEITVMLYRSTEKFGDWTEYSVYFDALVSHVTAVAVDKSEYAYLGVFLADDDISKNVVVKFSPGGQELKRLDLPVQQREEEVYRSLRVNGEGQVFQMIVESNDVVIRRYVP